MKTVIILAYPIYALLLTVPKSTSRTSANRKPGGRSVVGAGSSKKVCDMLAERNRTDGRSSTMSSATESRVTPIPPIETVMRSPLPDASTVLSNQPDQGRILLGILGVHMHTQFYAGCQ